MPFSEQVLYFTDPMAAAFGIALFCMQTKAAGSEATPPVLVTREGYAAFHVITEGSPSDVDVYYVMITVAAGQKMGAMQMLQSAAASSFVTPYSSSNTDSSWAVKIEELAGYFGVTIEQLFEDICDAFIEALPVLSVQGAAGRIGSAVLTFQITVDIWCAVWSVSMQGFDVDGQSSESSWYLADSVSSRSAVAVSLDGGNAQAGKIASALEDIAAQDFDIAINNGQAIFSVKGKSTRTAPG